MSIEGQYTTEKLLTVQDLAEVLQVDRSWVYRAVRLRKIPVIKAGKYCRFRLSLV